MQPIKVGWPHLDLNLDNILNFKMIWLQALSSVLENIVTHDIIH